MRDFWGGVYSFQNSLVNIKFKRRGFSSKNCINVYTATFDQMYAFLMKKRFFFYYPRPFNNTICHTMEVKVFVNYKTAFLQPDFCPARSSWTQPLLAHGRWWWQNPRRCSSWKRRWWWCRRWRISRSLRDSYKWGRGSRRWHQWLYRAAWVRKKSNILYKHGQTDLRWLMEEDVRCQTHAGQPSKVETVKRAIIPISTLSKLKSLLSQILSLTIGWLTSPSLYTTNVPLWHTHTHKAQNTHGT